MHFGKEDIEGLAQVARLVLDGLNKKDGFPESPTLKKKFRCPNDGATNVQNIKAILNEAITSLTLDGKTIQVTGNSENLRRYRPGDEPKIPFFLLLAAPVCFFLAIAMLGMAHEIAACFLVLLITSLGGCAIWLFVYSQRHIEEEREAWRDKVRIADYHWHCHHCGGHFDPDHPESYQGLEPPKSLVPDDDTLDETESNIRPLRSEESSS